MTERKVAFVTGASRGIGKGIAVHLAKAGYDVAIGARTIHEGEEREHSSTIKKSNTTPLPGSLDSTSALIRAEGREALSVYMDLLDRTSLGAAAATVIERWGRVDVLVNNARYIGPGHMDLFMDTPVEILDRHIQANVIAPIILSKQVIPQMLERGHGVIMNLTSDSGNAPPANKAGEGGWGLGYGFSKSAVHRVAEHLHLELHDRGITTFNLNPGFVATERIAIDMKDFGFDASTGAPVDVIGAVAAWLVTAPEAQALSGTWVEAQELCLSKGLWPDWRK